MTQTITADRPAMRPTRSLELETVDRADFIRAMAGAANSVSVVTTDGRAGRVGITVSSVSSVSADPPLVLVCVNRRSPAHRAMRENAVFAVNLLGTRHRELADTFAGRPSHGSAYDFNTDAWSRGATGAPRLADAVSSFECVLDQAHDAGSHTVFIGRVVSVAGAGGRPLLYGDRSYGGMCELN
jgi:flavin reductase